MNKDSHTVVRPWQRIEPTIITKVDYHNVIVKTYTLPDGNMTTRATFLSEGRRAAGVIAVTKDNQIIVARQFRPGPERIMNEIPGGWVEEGEDPQVAAMRELKEETGYTSQNVSFLGEFSRDSYINGRWFYYLALDCEPTDVQALDDNEFVSVELCSIDEFIHNAKQGNMTDPFAVLAAYDQLLTLQGKVNQ